MREKRFSVGDIITYKTDISYYYGGVCPQNLKGKIIDYGDFNTFRKAYEITVTHDDGDDYLMLESEFEEYDQPQEQEEEITPDSYSMTRSELIGRKFIYPSEGLFHIEDVVGNTYKLRIYWYKEDGHPANGSTTYTVGEIRDKISSGTWKLVPVKDVSNYEIF